MARYRFKVTETVLPSNSQEKFGQQHTLGHVNCPVCEGTRSMYVGTISKEMTFSEAVSFYLTWREAPSSSSRTRRTEFVATRTLKDYKQKAKPLKKFFGDMPLETIRHWHMLGYQEARLKADGFTRAYGQRVIASPAGGNKINSELALLKKLMQMCQCWTPEHEMYYRPFKQVEGDTQRALSFDEQEHFLCVASQNPRWHPIWWYALVAIHLTFSSDEMRTIRLGDINIPMQMVSVNPNFGKNSERRRTNTIEDGTVLWALQRLMEWSEIKAKTWPDYVPRSPHYFLFPKRLVRNLYNPELPMGETGLRKLFDEVCDKAELGWFPFNGFRHTGATRLAERRVPPYILEKRMGHVGQKMMKKYVQIGEQAERIAMKEAFARKPVASIRQDDWTRRSVS